MPAVCNLHVIFSPQSVLCLARVDGHHAADQIGMQSVEEEQQFLQQTARLCDGRFIPAHTKPAAADLCTKPADGSMPSQQVWVAKHAGEPSLLLFLLLLGYTDSEAVVAIENSGDFIHVLLLRTS